MSVEVQNFLLSRRPGHRVTLLRHWPALAMCTTEHYNARLYIYFLMLQIHSYVAIRAQIHIHLQAEKSVILANIKKL